MTQFEYRVIPAPVRGIKARGARTPEDRFALALAEVMNDLGRDGWEYLRCDTLPSEERTGLTGRTTVYRNMLVFRRSVAAAAPATETKPPQDVAAPASFAARVAATLRPGAQSSEGRRREPASSTAPARPASAGNGAEDGPDQAVPATPALGPADRGQVGAAPRLVIADREDADTARARPDGTATV